MFAYIFRRLGNEKNHVCVQHPYVGCTGGVALHCVKKNKLVYKGRRSVDRRPENLKSKVFFLEDNYRGIPIGMYQGETIKYSMSS